MSMRFYYPFEENLKRRVDVGPHERLLELVMKPRDNHSFAVVHNNHSSLQSTPQFAFKERWVKTWLAGNLADENYNLLASWFGTSVTPDSCYNATSEATTNRVVGTNLAHAHAHKHTYIHMPGDELLERLAQSEDTPPASPYLALQAILAAPLQTRPGLQPLAINVALQHGHHECAR